MAIKALFVMIFVFGAATYLATALTTIIYALRNNNASRTKRIISGIIGLIMIWGFIYGAIYLHKYGGVI